MSSLKRSNDQVLNQQRFYAALDYAIKQLTAVLETQRAEQRKQVEAYETTVEKAKPAQTVSAQTQPPVVNTWVLDTAREFGKNFDAARNALVAVIKALVAQGQISTAAAVQLTQAIQAATQPQRLLPAVQQRHQQVTQTQQAPTAPSVWDDADFKAMAESFKAQSSALRQAAVTQQPSAPDYESRIVASALHDTIAVEATKRAKQIPQKEQASYYQSGITFFNSAEYHAAQQQMLALVSGFLRSIQQASQLNLGETLNPSSFWWNVSNRGAFVYRDDEELENHFGFSSVR